MDKHQNRKLKIGTADNYRHAWYLLIWIVYFILYYAAEHLITDNYWVSYLPLDDKIPFCRFFILPYCIWHPLLFAMTVYLFFHDVPAFKRFMVYIGLGFGMSMVFCLLFPNGQDLRPASFDQKDFFTWLIGRIYAADTNTNVLPSMHVVGTLAAVRAAFEPECFDKKLPRWAVAALGLMINASTVLVKQHSLLDLLAGLALYLLIYPFIYVLPDKLLRKKA